MTRIAALLSCVALSLATYAETAEAPKIFPAREAKAHIGETITLSGKVDGVRIMDSGMTLINLDGHYPEQACTIVVRPQHAKEVGDLSGLDAKTIQVTGKVTDYKGKPQIEVTKRDAIVEAKAEGKAETK